MLRGHHRPINSSTVNQQAIAKKLKISVATVSRSLANHPGISEQTRDRVLQLAEEWGYRKASPQAKRGSALRIGVLVGLQPNSSPLATFPYILKGIQDRAADEGVLIDVTYPDPNTFSLGARANPVNNQIRQGNWNGLILVYPYSPSIAAALTQKIPVVSTLEEYDQLRIDCIDTNHHAGIFMMVNRLVGLGHSRIGFVTWTYPTTGTWVAQRFAAFVAGIFTHGLEFRQDWIVNMHKSESALTPAAIADRVAGTIRDHRVTAWVCAADHQAYQLMMDLNARGLRAPEHYSITGFDGIEPPLSLPRVTTQRVPNEAIGAAALGRLVNRIKHPQAERRKIFVDTEFIMGSTTGPAPQ